MTVTGVKAAAEAASTTEHRIRYLIERGVIHPTREGGNNGHAWVFDWHDLLLARKIRGWTVMGLSPQKAIALCRNGMEDELVAPIHAGGVANLDAMGRMAGLWT